MFEIYTVLEVACNLEDVFSNFVAMQSSSAIQYSQNNPLPKGKPLSLVRLGNPSVLCCSGVKELLRCSKAVPPRKNFKL
jgi:hypothetical protein